MAKKNIPRANALARSFTLAALAAGTPVHFLCYEFKGRELVRLEEVETRVRVSPGE